MTRIEDRSLVQVFKFFFYRRSYETMLSETDRNGAEKNLKCLWNFEAASASISLSALAFVV